MISTCVRGDARMLPAFFFFPQDLRPGCMTEHREAPCGEMGSLFFIVNFITES